MKEQWKQEPLDPCLLFDFFCRPGWDLFTVPPYGELLVGYRTVPDLMVPAVSDLFASGFLQQLDHF